MKQDKNPDTSPVNKDRGNPHPFLFDTKTHSFLVEPERPTLDSLLETRDLDTGLPG